MQDATSDWYLRSPGVMATIAGVMHLTCCEAVSTYALRPHLPVMQL